ncbi:MAG: hypothetical protein ACRD0Q_06695, partial [Acidimicrobiales bacterium]
MLRGTDVAAMMTRVETVLSRAERSAEGARGVVHVPRDGGAELGIDRMRNVANVVIEFPSGSARPLVGPAVRFAKRAVRRSLRWYLGPIMEHQSRFNHALLDLAEKLRLANEKLVAAEVKRLEQDQAAIESRLDAVRADVDAGLTGTATNGPPASSALRPSTRRSLKYRAFEDRHRGCGADIAKILGVYLPFFSGCRRVLDVGCGRGEFLTVLR